MKEDYSRKTGSGIPDTGRETPQDPEQQIRYTIDLTRQYHNLLVSEDCAGQKEQTFYWDGNVAAMEEAGQYSCYLQDDLGSPMHLLDENGEIRESYGYDEFGMPLEGFPENPLQPFGFTGYQTEEAGGLYFAQARRYDTCAGRFVSEDFIRGFIMVPHTLSRYSYCWNQPMEHVDPDGKFPWIVFPIFFMMATALLTGCSSEGQNNNRDNSVTPIPDNHEFKYTPEVYNSDEYILRTNCYAYAFDVVNNPVTGEQLYTRNEIGVFANQPGLFSNQFDKKDTSILSGAQEGNKRLVELVQADARAMGLNFQEYKPDMSGGYAVLLVINPQVDYHWYRQDADGTWSHKLGQKSVITGVENPIKDAKQRGYTSIVGYYYITEECDEN